MGRGAVRLVNSAATSKGGTSLHYFISSVFQDRIYYVSLSDLFKSKMP